MHLKFLVSTQYKIALHDTIYASSKTLALSCRGMHALYKWNRIKCISAPLVFQLG